jgi:hypothetical protein
VRRILIRRRNVVYLLLLIFLSVGLWLPRLRGPLDLRYDAGVYYILGTSLAEGKGYRLLNEPGRRDRGNSVSAAPPPFRCSAPTPRWEYAY